LEEIFQRIEIWQDLLDIQDIFKFKEKKRILYDRLKVPPVINQFSFTLEKSVRKELFKLLEKYKPESKVDKKKD